MSKTDLNSLLQIAMLGTERQALTIAPEGGPLDPLLAQLDLNQREQALLTTAVLRALHDRAGALPGRDPAVLAAPCPPESQPRIKAYAGSLLGRLLEGEQAQLLPECLSLMAGARQLAAAEFLPALLAAGAAHADLREAILPALGQRGSWLAAQNPTWAWVGGAQLDETVWQTGEQPARMLFLRQLRRTTPARAVELLTTTWKEETPDDRAAFVAELATGLNPGDEPLLEAALDDKRKEVRRAASTLLPRLPESALVRRMIERARPLLKFTAGEPGAALKLRRAKKAALEASLPTACDKAMQRDGIDPKPPHGFGEKAWWLIQMLESVPLPVWTSAWQTTPAEIVAAAQGGDWSKEFFEAWTRAAVRQRNHEWADTLFGAALAGHRFDKLDGLLTALTAPQRENRLAALLAQNDRKTRELHGPLLAQCRHDWSPAFSRAVLASMRQETSAESADWVLRNQFKELAPFLAPAILVEAAAGWKTDGKPWEFWAKGVDEFLSVTQFRAELHQAFATTQ